MAGSGIMGAMRCDRWRYECGACGTIYDLPGADLSFHHGEFLGVSRGGQAVLLSAVDTIYEQVTELVEGIGPTDPATQGLVIRQIIGLVCDPDRYGDPFIFDGSPGCPDCGAKEVADVIETGERWPEHASRLRCLRWETLTTEEKYEAVGYLVGASKVDGLK